MKEIKIYTLSDPETGEIRYIGKTQQKLTARLTKHLYEALNTSRISHKINWIKSLNTKKLKPKIELIDIVDELEWIFWEKYWISQFKTWGFKLTNLTEGGDGSNHTQETIEKIKLAVSGKNHYLFGGNLNPETIKKISQSLRGNQRAKGFKHSEETRKKISEGGKGRAFSKEHKKRLSESQKGDPNKVKIIKIYNENRELIAELPTREACRFSGLKPCQIKELIKNGKRTIKKKFSFSY